jgi:hypothetical protein
MNKRIETRQSWPLFLHDRLANIAKTCRETDPEKMVVIPVPEVPYPQSLIENHQPLCEVVSLQDEEPTTQVIEPVEASQSEIDDKDEIILINIPEVKARLNYRVFEMFTYHLIDQGFKEAEINRILESLLASLPKPEAEMYYGGELSPVIAALHGLDAPHIPLARQTQMVPEVKAEEKKEKVQPSTSSHKDKKKDSFLEVNTPTVNGIHNGVQNGIEQNTKESTEEKKVPEASRVNPFKKSRHKSSRTTVVYPSNETLLSANGKVGDEKRVMTATPIGESLPSGFPSTEMTKPVEGVNDLGDVYMMIATGQLDKAIRGYLYLVYIQPDLRDENLAHFISTHIFADELREQYKAEKTIMNIKVDGNQDNLVIKFTLAQGSKANIPMSYHGVPLEVEYKQSIQQYRASLIQ